MYSFRFATLLILEKNKSQKFYKFDFLTNMHCHIVLIDKDKYGFIFI